MDLRHITFSLLCVAACAAHSFADTKAAWTWVGGASSTNQYGIYGTKGVASPTNFPGGRDRSISWTDPCGNFWLFGGEGYGASGYGLLNDLWKFDGANWTWVSGSSVVNQCGVYGSIGQFAPSNMPGGRYCATVWVDGTGQFWIFGGIGYPASGSNGLLNDLWRFNGIDWAWMGGYTSINDRGFSEGKGVTSPINVPGARGGAAGWADASGNLWLFGGQGWTTMASGYLNDLWKLHWPTAQWTWVGGSNLANQVGIYAAQGQPSADSIPGGRACPMVWKISDNDIRLFGGHGWGSSGEGYFSDLWKFDGTNWTWVSGSGATNQPGVYGEQGVPASTNIPGARYSAAVWTDANDNLWLYGGSGYAAGASTGWLSDLWQFNGENWIWMAGSTANILRPVYGQKGVASSANTPGGRTQAISWVGADGKLWLLGGYGYAAVIGQGWPTDLWKFGIPDEAADMSGNGMVDGVDLMTLAAQWESVPGTPSADLAPQPAGDGVVNFRDFAVLANNWLQSM